MTEINVDTDHPVMLAFRAVGYPPHLLRDPGHVTPEDLEEGDWRVVRYQDHGIELFDVGRGDVVDQGRSEPYHLGVEYIEDVVQPIGFAEFSEDAEPVNADLPDMEKIGHGSRTDVTFIVGPDVDPEPADFTEQDAIEALGLWGSEGWLTKEAVWNITHEFDITGLDVSYKDDPHASGVQITRAPPVVARLAGTVTGTQATVDDGITGHKKRRRQRFYRNLDLLESYAGIEE